MSLPTAEEITNWYLYGQKKTPSPDELISSRWIRPKELSEYPSVDISTPEFMSAGPGRFAIGRQFEIVNNFFTADSHKLPVGTYTKQQIASKFGLSRYDWKMQQYNYADGSGPDGKDDYAERGYIYNTQSFKLVDDVKFVVERDGRRRIENFAVIPRVDPQKPENFDFNSDNPLAKIINPLLKRYIDPSDIGRKVIINFTDTDKVPRITYDGNSYFNDQSKIIRWNDSGVLRESMIRQLDSLFKKPLTVNSPFNDNPLADLSKRLFDSGTTRFIDSKGRPIIYGKYDGGEVKIPGIRIKMINKDLWGAFYPNQAEYAKNGVVFVGGKGSDIFKNIPANSAVYSGEGKDVFEASFGKANFTILDPSPNDRISLPHATAEGKILNSIISGPAYRDSESVFPVRYLHKTPGNDLFSMTVSGKDLVIMGGGEIMARDFKSGDLGINLGGPVESGSDINSPRSVPPNINNWGGGIKR